MLVSATNVTELNSGVPSRIIGGTPTIKGRYPYMCGLYRTFPSPGKLPVCGGTLIAPNLVLTAGHCQSATHVKVGCHDMLDENEKCESFSVAETLVHPDFFLKRVPFNDVLILVLDGSSSFSPIPHYFVGRDTYFQENISFGELTVMGWGNTVPGRSSQSSILLETNVFEVPQEACAEDYQELYPNSVQDSMICAAAENRDSCQGDSGGPLIVSCDSRNDVLIGIVSWGSGCADKKFPGVYTRLSSFTDFIEGIIESHGKGHSSVEFSLESSNNDEFCSTASPTLTPSIPQAWTCHERFYAVGDGCDCNCGALDPDCIESKSLVFNCAENETCSEGKCVALQGSGKDSSVNIDTPKSLTGVVVVLGCILSILIAIVALVLVRKRRKEKPKHFTDDDLVKATKISDPPELG